MRNRRQRRRWQRMTTATTCTVLVALGLVAGPAPHVRSESEGARSTRKSTPFPRWLSQTGLYDEQGNIDTRNRHFTPQYPLWSDGASKSRWIHLPPGTQIDISDVDLWHFPVGTKFWKEFSWDGRKVETRLMRKSESSQWEFAAYVWTEDQSDAILAPAEGIPSHYAIMPNKRHSIPSVADCNSCHASSPGGVLGFNALQLSDDRDPLAPNAEGLTEGDLTLGTLLAAHLVTPPRPDLVESPPRIRAADPTERAALGYLSANCGGCHNGSGPLARLGFSLLHDVLGDPSAAVPARVTTIDAATRFKIPGIDPDSTRLIVPGRPDRSAIFYRMHSRRPSTQMPPFGTVTRDELALELVRRWIQSLHPQPSHVDAACF